MLVGNQQGMLHFQDGHACLIGRSNGDKITLNCRMACRFSVKHQQGEHVTDWQQVVGKRSSIPECGPLPLPLCCP